MKHFLSHILFCMTLLLGTLSWAIDPVQFEDPVQEERFKALIDEFRCLQCQNQNLADSNAPLAVDLRREIAAMIRAGNTDDEIRGFLVQRYGDFVLYRPPVKPSTWMLWFGPLLLLAVSATAVIVIVRKRARAVDAPLPDSQRRAADQLAATDSDS